MALHILVLAGGSGTRLWPLSRGDTPKHLLPLGPGGVTLLRATLDRVGGIGGTVQVVTAEAQAEGCRAELASAGLDPHGVIAEPEPRGTGPALALATELIHLSDPDALVVSVHADARVPDAGAYREAVVASAGWALAQGSISTVGLVPAYPSAGMGYIDKGVPLDPQGWQVPSPDSSRFAAAARDVPAFSAAGFVEKPAPELAAEFVRGGRHLWNLGLFAWPAQLFLAELGRLDPELRDGVERVAAAREAGDEESGAEIYRSLRPQPVEPLLLERGAPLVVVQASFAWSDLGSWQDLYEARLAEGGGDSDGNVVDGDALLIDSRGNQVVSRGRRAVALVDVHDLVVVDTPDALLVVPRDRSQRVREVVEKLGNG